MRNTKLARELRPFLNSPSAAVALAPVSGSNHAAASGGAGILVDANQVVSLDPNAAGAGLTYSTGILAVGAGAGLTVGTDSVALTTPGTLAVNSTNSAAGSHTHAITSSSNPGAAASLLATDASGFTTVVQLTATSKVRTPLLDTASGDLTLTPAANVVLSNGKAVRSVTFVSGFAGSGFRVDQGVAEAGKTTAEVDNLWVRGRMHVYELLIHQIRATNGSIFVSNTGKVSAITYVSGADWDIVTDPEHGFAAGDLIRAQRFTGSGAYQTNMQVKDTPAPTATTFRATYISGNSPAVGMEFVRLGSATDATRRGGVYLTADDSGAPFIDVFDGVDAFSDWNTAGVVKARLGSLAGLGVGSAGEYGLFVGSGQATTDTWLKASTAGVRQVNVSSEWYSGGTKFIGISATDGIQIKVGTTTDYLRAYSFVDSADAEIGAVFGSVTTGGSATQSVALQANNSDNPGRNTDVSVAATNTWGAQATAAVTALSGGALAQIVLTAVSGSGARTIEMQGNVSVGDALNDLVLSSRYVRARNANGLRLEDDGGNLGIFVEDGGQVGVGTATPESALHVKGASAVVRLAGTLTNQNLQMQLYDNDATLKGSLLYSGGGGTGFKYFGLYNASADWLGFFSDGSHRWLTAGATELMRLDGTGLGIGATPTEKLHVSGKILGQMLQVTADSGGTAGRVSIVNATSAVSTGTGTVKMAGTTARNSDLWLKIYVGTTAYYLPAWSNIS